jgi:hypothetical protein
MILLQWQKLLSLYDYFSSIRETKFEELYAKAVETNLGTCYRLRGSRLQGARFFGISGAENKGMTSSTSGSLELP